MRRAPALLGLAVMACVPVAPLPPPVAPAPVRLDPPVPAPLPTIAGLIAADLTPTGATMFRAAGLDALFEGPGPFTVFLPSEAAWARLTPPTRAALLLPENRGSLVALMRMHVVEGRLELADLRRRAAFGPVAIPTLAGDPLRAVLDGGELVISGAGGRSARLADDGRAASNGVAYRIDGLLVPQALGPQS